MVIKNYELCKNLYTLIKIIFFIFFFYNMLKLSKKEVSYLKWIYNDYCYYSSFYMPNNTQEFLKEIAEYSNRLNSYKTINNETLKYLIWEWIERVEKEIEDNRKKIKDIEKDIEKKIEKASFDTWFRKNMIIRVKRPDTIWNKGDYWNGEQYDWEYNEFPLFVKFSNMEEYEEYINMFDLDYKEREEQYEKWFDKNYKRFTKLHMKNN